MLNRIKSFTSSFRPKRHSKKMSTTVHNDNKACCSVPPVPSSYQPKGTIQKWGGFEQVRCVRLSDSRLAHFLYVQVYITGPEKSDNAILCVFDIFGSVSRS